MGKFLGLIVRKDAVNSPSSPGGIAAHQVVSSIPLGEEISTRSQARSREIKSHEPCPLAFRDAFLNGKFFGFQDKYSCWFYREPKFYGKD